MNISNNLIVISIVNSYIFFVLFRNFVNNYQWTITRIIVYPLNEIIVCVFWQGQSLWCFVVFLIFVIRVSIIHNHLLLPFKIVTFIGFYNSKGPRKHSISHFYNFLFAQCHMSLKWTCLLLLHNLMLKSYYDHY